jgi:hypothetical protein
LVAADGRAQVVAKAEHASQVKSAQEARLKGPQQRIVNGLATVTFPSTVALLRDPDELTHGEVFCTATLVGCQTVLTAAHCVCLDDPGGVDGESCQAGGANLKDPATIRVFAQSGGVFPVTAIDVPEHYEFGVAADIALLHLGAAVNGISPAILNETGTPPMGAGAFVVGFGRTAEVSPGDAGVEAGVKRYGNVTIGACNFVPESDHLCFTFDAPFGAPGQDSGTCHGDSGGPLFTAGESGLVQSGVASGAPTSCVAPPNHWHADVFVEREWIAGAGGADLASKSCGTLAQVGSPEVGLFVGEGVLDAGDDPEDFWSVDVPPGTKHLRVTLNGLDGSDFDLFVRQGALPTDEQFDCGPLLAGHVEVCDFPAPAAGTWYLRVQWFSGPAARYQTTITVFGPVPPLHANGFESGDTGGWSRAVP